MAWCIPIVICQMYIRHALVTSNKCMCSHYESWAVMRCMHCVLSSTSNHPSGAKPRQAETEDLIAYPKLACTITGGFYLLLFHIRIILFNLILTLFCERCDYTDSRYFNDNMLAHIFTTQSWCHFAFFETAFIVETSYLGSTCRILLRAVRCWLHDCDRWSAGIT